MKTSIKVYLIALINTHRNEISPNVSTLVNNHTRKSINELINLLEFVNAIPEEKVTDTYVEINRLRAIIARFEVDTDTETIRRRTLQKRVAELEEMCETMNEVEKNLREKIENLELANISYSGYVLKKDKMIDQHRAVITRVGKENKRLKVINKHSLKRIKILKNQLKTKLKGDC
ncbi:hypothetical protein LGL08_20155 [Clostridium estertheticum]|uniref:hypothetical protein n=1 Tax=Clostridium estertheticum TaxID=238834 RepID=UPI001CF527F9|nr:hypothetical protein [Clostridium estertheticum]MCB2309019.1 hypothetical protein [Clostridium estertheticum]MCB2346847.1 hypothetical protein [Clostridium estertheticum]MCB2351841.1 hypothetical protein [Clostridium estertheticum]WAG48444.1 hypothetical protein LL127_22960 [Clostridium estertheticum]